MTMTRAVDVSTQAVSPAEMVAFMSHPLRDRARDERGRDDREHQLEHRVRLQRDRGRVRRIGVYTHPLEPQPGQAAPPGGAVSECDRVPHQNPLHADHAERDYAHHHRVERVLRPDQSAVEEGQAHRHDHAESRGCKHPGGVTRRNGGVHESSAAVAPTCCALSRAARCTASAFTAVSAALSSSPVRIRTTRSIGWTKILPSPTSPVRADERIALMHGSTNGSEHTISIFTFSWNSITTVVPRY